MSKKNIFISSVQLEFAKERVQLCSYIRQDALLGRFFEPFLFEELPAINASSEQAYLSEIASSDIYLGIIGNQYGFQDYEGISPTEREFDEAIDLQKYRICFFKTSSPQTEREPLGTPMIDVLTHLNLVSPRQQIKNAAILLFGKNPQRFFQTSEIKCAQFYGNEVTKPIPSYHVYQGDLFSLINQAVDFIMSRIDARVGTREKSVQAPIDFEFPLEAVRSVQVMLFKNRLEVWNPGHLPPGITIEQLYQVHESFPTNPLIANPLYLAGYAERLGTGTSDIIKKCVAIGLKPPTFSQSHNFRTTFRRNEEIEEANPITSEPNPTTSAANPTNSIANDVPNKVNMTSSIANDTTSIANDTTSKANVTSSIVKMTSSETNPITSETNPITSEAKVTTSEANMTTSDANVTTLTENEKVMKCNNVITSNSDLKSLTRLYDVPKHMTRKQIEELVISICSDEYLTVSQIASFIGRNTRYLLNIILAPMLAEGKLCRLFPETPNHPNQAYKANSNPKTTEEYAKEL